MHEVLAQPSVCPRVPECRVPCPKPDEVVMMALEKIDVGFEVKAGRGIVARHVYQVVPGVGSGQINDLQGSVRIPGSVGEVARIVRVDTQRSPGGRRSDNSARDRQRHGYEDSNPPGVSGVHMPPVFLKTGTQSISCQAMVEFHWMPCRPWKACWTWGRCFSRREKMLLEAEPRTEIHLVFS